PADRDVPDLDHPGGRRGRPEHDAHGGQQPRAGRERPQPGGAPAHHEPGGEHPLTDALAATALAAAGQRTRMEFARTLLLDSGVLYPNSVREGGFLPKATTMYSTFAVTLGVETQSRAS